MDNIEDIKSGAQIKLDLKIDHSAADGKTSNKAKVTVTQNNLALNNWGVRFSISSGNATFSNGLKTLDTKTANGIADAEFTDGMIESGTITVIETTNDMNQPITNGSSDSKPYHFGPDGEVTYNLTMKKIDDGAAADGIAQDSASVIIKDKNNNTPTSGTFIITFTSSSNTTKFDVSKSNVDKRSTSSTLYVNATLNNDRELEALAYFSDTVGEDAVRITASLLDNQSTKMQDAQFSFKNDSWVLTTERITDYAVADGISTDMITVTLTLNGDSVPDKLNPIIQLELDNSDVSFDLTGSLNGSTHSRYLVKAEPYVSPGSGFNRCNVFFTATKPCTGKVSVSVPRLPQIKTQYSEYTFNPNSYVLNLEKLTDNANYISGEYNKIGAYITPLAGHGSKTDFLVSFTANYDSNVTFDTTSPDVDQDLSKPEKVYVYTRVSDQRPRAQAQFISSSDKVTIISEIQDYSNPESKNQLDFSFTDDYQKQFVFDNNIFRSTENVTAYYKCLDIKGKPIIGKNIIFVMSDSNFYINNTDNPVEKQTDSNGIAQVQIRGLHTGVDEVTNLEIYVDNLPEYKKLFYHNSSPFKISIGEQEKVGSEIRCNLTRFPMGDDPIQVQLSIVDESLTPDEDVYFVLNNSNKMTATVLSTPYNVSLASRKNKTSRLYVSFKNGDDEQYRSVPIAFY